jgi:hypothetical protein
MTTRSPHYTAFHDGLLLPTMEDLERTHRQYFVQVTQPVHAEGPGPLHPDPFTSYSKTAAAPAQFLFYRRANIRQRRVTSRVQYAAEYARYAMAMQAKPPSSL